MNLHKISLVAEGETVGGTYPVFVLPNALNAFAEHLGRRFSHGLFDASAQGARKPGLLVAVDGPGLFEMLEALAVAMDAQTEVRHLRRAEMRISAEGLVLVSGLLRRTDVDLVAEHSTLGDGDWEPLFFKIAASTLLAEPLLATELPGSIGMLAVCDDEAQLLALAERPGNYPLACVYSTEDDAVLKDKIFSLMCGRTIQIVSNGLWLDPEI